MPTEGGGVHEGLLTLRALATVAVVQLHCLRPYFEASKDPRPLEDAYRCVLDFATPSFFFMAGYFSQPRDTAKRIARASVPLFVATAIKHLLRLAYYSNRRVFWRSLLQDLALHHLGPDKFPEDCVLHDKLAPLANHFHYDSPLPGPTTWLVEALTGTAFGHYYFVPVLCQLHVIGRVLAPCTDLTWFALFLSFVWHPLRARPFVGVPDRIAWRLPFLWLAYFVNGVALKKRLRNEQDTRTLAIVAYCLAALGIAVSIAAAGAGIPSWFYLVFKDLWGLALPPAVCLSVNRCHITIPGALRFLRDELARLSYFTYLYHGFFLHRQLDLGLPTRLAAVLPATLALAYVLEATLRPNLLSRAFGFAPRHHSHWTRPTKQQEAASPNSQGEHAVLA